VERSTTVGDLFAHWKTRTALLLAVIAIFLIAVAAVSARPAAAAGQGFCMLEGNKVDTALSQSQCDALMSFYGTTGGDLHWTNKTGWALHDSDPCSVTKPWFGVTCQGDYVTELDVPGNGLDGWLSAQLEDLPALVKVDIHNNNVGGWLPAEFGGYTQLEYLDVSYNDLTGDITEAMDGTMDTLVTLHLSDGPGGNGCFSVTSPALAEQISVHDPNWDECASSCMIGGTKTRTVACQAECDALVGLYNATDGPNWTSFAGWNTPTDPCQWHGVTCSSAGVTKLELWKNNLTGPVPASIGGLTNMTFLMLVANHLTSLPNEIGDLASLETFYMGDNPLPELPAGIGNLSKLTDLMVEQAHLTALPKEIGNLHKLKDLDVVANELTSLPDEMARLDDIERLGLSYNHLTGDITAPMAGIKDTLTHLWISEGHGFNNCLTVTDLSVATWLDGMDKDWAECDLHPSGPDIVVVGGPAAVSSGVFGGLAGLTSGSVSRVYGANRYSTAVAISATNFAPGVSTAYLATGANYPDALAAGPAAGTEGAPVLLVGKTFLPSETASELARLKPGRIVVVGGTAVVTDAVLTAAAKYTKGSVVRVAGANRYATAADVSSFAFSPGVGTVVIATGENFPDALAGGPAAIVWGGPMLLVQHNAVPTATVAELQRLKPGRIVVLGGTAAVSSSVASQLAAYTSGTVTRISGPNRYATAAAISAAAFSPSTDAVFVATGRNFPDAVAAGPAAGMHPAPILLVDTGTPVPSSTATELKRLGS